MAVRAFIGRFGPDHGAAHAFFGDPFEFLGAGLNVFKRDESERQEPLWIMAAIIDRPVVIGPKAGVPQLDIIQAVERHAHGGVDHLGLQAVPLLVLDARGGVPDAGRGGLKALPVVCRQLFRRNAGTKKTGHRYRVDVLAHKELALFSVKPLDRVRSLIPEFLIQSFRPHIGRLYKMRICRNHSRLCHNSLLGCHECLPKRTTNQTYRLLRPLSH